MGRLSPNRTRVIFVIADDFESSRNQPVARPYPDAVEVLKGSHTYCRRRDESKQRTDLFACASDSTERYKL